MKLRELPEGFRNMLRSTCPGDVAEKLIGALETTEPSVSVLANTLRGAAIAEGHDPVPLSSGAGAYLDGRPIFAADPAWHQGLYYVQDASSMATSAAVGHIIKTYFGNTPLRYLDTCAAPGGKTIAAIAQLPEGSAVLANEYDRKRAAVLLENLGRHGFPSVAVSSVDGASLGCLGEIFDIVAVDAPCSGEGMMRKEPEAIRQWSPALVESCAATQRRILRGAWGALRPGGVLIYSTCTFNRMENEENVAFIADELGGESIALPLGDFPGVLPGFSTEHHCYHFLPGFVRGEGLFIAAMRKPGGNAALPKMKAPQRAKDPSVAAFAAKAIKDSDCYTIIAFPNDSFSVIPESHAPFFGHLHFKLRLLRCGLPLCRLKGKDIQPAWELAFSTIFCNDAFPLLLLNREASLAYLHGDSLTDIPEGLEKGIVTVTYNGIPLGFAKNIGRRANNLYPEQLRLRMDPHTAAQQPPTTITKMKAI